MDLDLLRSTLDELGQPAYRFRQVRQAATQALAGDWEDLTALPKGLRAELAARIPFSTVTVDHEERSGDGSVKLRLLTADGYPLEAVLMRFDSPHTKTTGRYTACLSSQSGCALACTFCATGTMGLGRNLSPWEIVDQFLTLARIRNERGEGRIDNVVMMGMGEPLHNYDRVIAALTELNDPEGVGLAARRIAISTAGWIPGIDKLAAEPRQFKLALSLHAPNNTLRTELMPVTKKYPIDDLLAACRRYRAQTRRRIFVEYLMLEGVNDQVEHARELAQLLGPDGFHVNLIAYNPTGSGYVGSSDDQVVRFAKVLEAGGVRSSYRISRGRDIAAACGQLAAPLAAVKRAARARKVAAAAAAD